MTTKSGTITLVVEFSGGSKTTDLKGILAAVSRAVSEVTGATSVEVSQRGAVLVGARPEVNLATPTWRLVQWHIDPGHAWLRVPVELLADKELRESISHYSYMDSEFAYLEEDCDFGRFEAFWFGNGALPRSEHAWPEVRGDYADGHVDRGFTNPRGLGNYSADAIECLIGGTATD